MGYMLHVYVHIITTIYSHAELHFDVCCDILPLLSLLSMLESWVHASSICDVLADGLKYKVCSFCQIDRDEYLGVSSVDIFYWILLGVLAGLHQSCFRLSHYNAVIMSSNQITSFSIVCSTVCSGTSDGMYFKCMTFYGVPENEVDNCDWPYWYQGNSLGEYLQKTHLLMMHLRCTTWLPIQSGIQ